MWGKYGASFMMFSPDMYRTKANHSTGNRFSSINLLSGGYTGRWTSALSGMYTGEWANGSNEANGRLAWLH